MREPVEVYLSLRGNQVNLQLTASHCGEVKLVQHPLCPKGHQIAILSDNEVCNARSVEIGKLSIRLIRRYNKIDAFLA